MEKILSKIKTDMTSVIIGLTAFVDRQLNKLNNGLSQWMGEPKVLISLIKDAIGSGHYHAVNKSVMIVPIPMEWLKKCDGHFTVGHDKIQPGEAVETRWESRREGEAPVPVRYVTRKEFPKAESVDIVLYTGEALKAEGDEFSPSNSDLAVVSINAGSENFPANAPMNPFTIIRNFASKDPSDPIGKGGSFHAWKEMSFEDAYKDYLAKLEASFSFWHNIARITVK